ncbi:hypothetical protein GCM10008955_22020 [Deinococcus malanensis]|uniref:Uncharacterized protein n=1 Tax=Deinococcus malanensis TaxID=1706855 RepID=A0ABQ2EYD5_9DEIO|nr:hypothetical protein [Deinococcus malanensis]GGK27858.1 hypothetical protein GCM10008955_22020 [Deinococcus malanensis]
MRAGLTALGVFVLPGVLLLPLLLRLIPFDVQITVPVATLQDGVLLAGLLVAGVGIWKALRR